MELMPASWTGLPRAQRQKGSQGAPAQALTQVANSGPHAYSAGGMGLSVCVCAGMYTSTYRDRPYSTESWIPLQGWAGRGFPLHNIFPSGHSLSAATATRPHPPPSSPPPPTTLNLSFPEAPDSFSLFPGPKEAAVGSSPLGLIC